MKYKFLDLQLFADGGMEGTADSGLATAEDMGVSQNEGQPLPIEKSEEETTQEDLEKEYEELIKGKFRDIHKNKVQGIVKDRLKNSKATEKQLKGLTDILAEKYGIEKGDLSLNDISQKTYEALMSDESIFADKALEEGLTPEQAKNNYISRQKLAEAEAKLQEIEEEKQMQEKFSQWHNEELELQKKYPSFDLAKELENPAFASLMENPYFTMEQAYNAFHQAELISAVARGTAEQTEKNIANKLAAKQNRPKENGVSSQATSITKTDVRNLTNEQYNDILKRIQRGERISFS